MISSCISLLNITNEFRKQIGLDPIHDLEAYIPHFLKPIARAAARGEYPYVVDVYKWTGKKPPKKGSNPTALKRTVSKLEDDLNEVFSKDLGMLLKAMAKYDLRDIYLAMPYEQVITNIESQKGNIPADSLAELEEYLKYDIFDAQTKFDRSINNFIRATKIPDVVNFMLKPFGRVISNPIQMFSSTYRQLLMPGSIAAKPRLVIRNAFQRLLTLDFVSPIDFVKAQFSAPKQQMDEIRNTTFYKQSVKSFEDVPTLLKPIQWGMYPFQKSHAGLTYLSNIDVAMRAGYNSGQRKIDWCQTVKGQKEIQEYIDKHPDMTEDEKADLIWREGDQIMEAVEVGSYTQWMYFSSEMPRVFRGHGARAFWSLQSWVMNYFGKHVPEMSRRTFKGATGTGRIVPKAERYRAAKGLATLVAVLGILKKLTGIDMLKFAFFPFPTLVAPHAGQMVLHTYGYLLALINGEDAQGSLDKLQNNLKLLIPFSGATKRYLQMVRGDITVKEWLFYMENNNNWKQIWIKDEPKKDTAQSGVNYEEQSIAGDEEIIAGYGSEPIAGEDEAIAGYQ